MKTLHLLAGAVLATAGFAAPTMSMAATDTAYAVTLIEKGTTTIVSDASDEFAKRGRGRGRGGDDKKRDRSSNDDRRSDDSRSRPSRNDDSGSGRSRPRIPGGSGCDDPGDVQEHAECRG